MKPGYLWLLLPLATWCGYKTAAPSQGAGDKAPGPSQAATVLDPALLSWSTGLEKAGPGELEKQLGDLLADPTSPGWIDRLKLLCARWAEIDPAGALAFFAANKVPSVARHLLLIEWALLDSDAAWAAIPAGEEGDRERIAVTSSLLTEDRETFLWWFRQTPGVRPTGDPAWVLIAERYPDEIAGMAARVLEAARAPEAKGSDLATAFYRLLADTKARKDPAAAFEWAKGLDPLVRDAALRESLEIWSRSDPAAVCKALLSPDSADVFQNLKGKVELAQSVMTRLAAQDPTAVIQLLAEHPDSALLSQGSSAGLEKALVPALARGKMSALEAYRLLISAKGSASMIPLNVLPSVWRGMPVAALEEGAKAVLAEPANEWRGVALGGLANAWFLRDAAAALEFIGTIPDAELKAETYAGLFSIRNGLPGGPRQQADLLAMVPPEDRAAVLTSHLLRDGHPSPEPYRQVDAARDFHPDAIAPLLSELPPSKESNQAVEINAVKWGESEPAAALAWAARLKDPAARSAATAGALKGWAYHDPYAASDWLSDQPPGAPRDAGAASLVGHLAKSDPDAAWELASSIDDETLRLDSRVTALGQWAERDLEAARAAYRGIASKLPKAEAAKLSAALTGK
jgi:hypothetical protein